MIETSEDIIKDSESPHLSVLPGLACGSSFKWEKLTSVVPNTAPRLTIFKSSQVALVVKNPPANAGDIRDVGSIPSREDPLEESMATHSSVPA